MKRTAEQQYLDILKDIVDNGTWVYNERTKTRCKTIIDRIITIDPNQGIPVLTTKRTFFRAAIGEMLGYIRGYDNIKQFHKLGVKTWDANANNPVWLENKNRRREGDLGLIYGALGNRVHVLEYSDGSNGNTGKVPWRMKVSTDGRINWMRHIVSSLKVGNDDRGLIWNFWNPGLFHLGCLRPCMYEHQFSILGNKLYLSSNQRSQDVCLGGPFNLIQVYFLLWVMAKLSGLEMGQATLRVVNCHIYENQMDGALTQLEREPYPTPKLVCNKEITYESVFGLCENEEDNLHPRDFSLEGYQHHPAVVFPFTV